MVTMTPTIYGQILAEVLAQLPEARGAVLADWEGEAVDQAGELENTQLRLLGAHWGVVYFMARTSLQNHGHQGPRDLTLRFASTQVTIRRLTDEYYLVLASEPCACLGRILAVLDRHEPRLVAQL